ncbi:hypothetical protein MTP99_015091 [Tenebrio molitor]|nr:hypothetical protein MTP99_015091 [Tenebrio molitor]
MSNSHLFLKSGFIRTPSQNGVGRYVCQLQRVVLKFCKNNGSSRGMRDFIETELVDFAKNNPGIVVYLKPRRHRTAVISAEFLNGEKQWISCRNLTKEEITKWLTLLKTQSGNHQGPWTPYTFKDPAENIVEYPNKELSKARILHKTATEELLEIFNRQAEDPENRRVE